MVTAKPLTPEDQVMWTRKNRKDEQTGQYSPLPTQVELSSMDFENV